MKTKKSNNPKIQRKSLFTFETPKEKKVTPDTFPTFTVPTTVTSVVIMS